MEDIGTNASVYFGSIFRVWIVFLPFIFIYEPKHLKIILSSGKTSEKNFFYRVMHNFIGDGLITSNGEKWKRNRRLIQHYFQNNFLENYYEIFSQSAQRMVDNLSYKHRVKITEFVNDCVIDILHKAILGVTLNANEQSPFRRGELLIIKRILKPWLLLDGLFKHSEMSKKEKEHSSTLHQYVKKECLDFNLKNSKVAYKVCKVITQVSFDVATLLAFSLEGEGGAGKPTSDASPVLLRRLKDRKSQKTTNTCLLDYFIELMETTDFSEEDVLNECVTFMLAGQDSVAATVAFCLYYLAKNQDVQEKVWKEINNVTSKSDCQRLGLGQVMHMDYVEQCIKETLRLTPSVPIISRVLTSDVILGKYTLPAGLNIFISPFITHRLPHVFKNPLTFDPDRFSEEQLKKMPPYSFLPFSAGTRNCIGYKFSYLEMKTIIGAIIKNFHLTLSPGNEDVSLAYRVTLRATSGIFLDLKRRR